MTDYPDAQHDDGAGLVRALFGHPEGDPPATDHTPPNTATPAAPEPEADHTALVKAIFGGESR